MKNWKILVSLTVTALLMQGCALAPGMQVEAGPSGFFHPTEPVEEDDYTLVPVTRRVVESLESERLKAESSAAKREIPAEWIGDPARYDYRVGPPDLLQIIVWDHPELNMAAGTTDSARGSENPASDEGSGGGGVRVDPDGSIFFPFVGTLSVAGKTVAEIRTLITRALMRYFPDPQVDVRVTGFRSQKVHVVGEVKEPKDVPVTDAPLRLVDAISEAGGTAPTAALDKVRVIREGRQIRLSLLDIYDRNRGDENILLRDGDIVQVENLDSETIFVMGEVRSQGARPLERGRLTLAAALQASGGINQETADANKVLVLRQGKAKPVVYYLNANEPGLLVLATRFPLQQSDIVYVSTSNMYRLGKIMRTLLLPIQYGTAATVLVK